MILLPVYSNLRTDTTQCTNIHQNVSFENIAHSTEEDTPGKINKTKIDLRLKNGM